MTDKKEKKETDIKARDSYGQFVPGSKHALGNVNRHSNGYQKKNIDAFRKIMDIKKVEVMIKAMYKLALTGNYQACSYILDRCIGRQKFEVDIKSEGEIVFTLNMGRELEPIELPTNTLDIIDIVPTIIKETEKIESSPNNLI